MDTRSTSVCAGHHAPAPPPAVRPPPNGFSALDNTKDGRFRITGGLSSAALTMAIADLFIHLASAPRKRLELAALARSNVNRIGGFVLRSLARYAAAYLSGAKITLMPTNGAHNAAIVNKPAQAHRQFRIECAAPADLRVGPDAWIAAAAPRDGSWWPAWPPWLAGRSTKGLVATPHMGVIVHGPASLADAPGTYILQN
jgi:hypothetical protein